MLFERIGLELHDDRVFAFRAGRNDQDRFGQPVARAERGPAEPVRAEPGGERVQDLGVDQLSGVARGPPGREVEPLALFRPDPAGAQVVGEVGRLAVRRPISRDRPQPRRRPLDESERRHQVRRGRAVEGLEQRLDQAIIVEVRQPRHRDALGRVAADLLQLGRIEQQAPMVDHHALGLGRGTGSVLQVRQVRRRTTGVRATAAASPRSMSSVVSHRGGARAEDRQAGLLEQRPDRRGREHPPSLGVVGDRLEPGLGPLQPRGLGRRRRDADQARVEAAEEPDQEIQARRVDQEHALARRGGRLEPGGHRPCPLVQLGVRDPLGLDRPVFQEHEREPVAMAGSPFPQQIHQCFHAIRPASRPRSCAGMARLDPADESYSFTMIAAPKVNPPPKAESPILPAKLPRSASSDKQRGMLDDEVLPWIFKLLKTFSSGKLSFVLSPLIMVWLPWWGTTRSRSAGRMPASSHARYKASTMRGTASLRAVFPSMTTRPLPCSSTLQGFP